MICNKFYYIAMTQKQLLENDVLEEILRERIDYYFSNKKIIDFWIFTNPDFLDSKELKKAIHQTNFYNQQKSDISTNLNQDFYSVILSSNINFINWVRLRLGYFENIDIKKEGIFSNDKEKNFNVSDGIYGTIELEKENKNILSKFDDFSLHPNLFFNKYKEISNYYSVINSKKLTTKYFEKNSSFLSSLLETAITN